MYIQAFGGEIWFMSWTIPASKELAVKGAVRSAGTFYHTGEGQVNCQ